MSDYEAKVQQQVERLSTCSLQQIEAEVAAKRGAWFEEPGRSRVLDRPATPRDGFEQLFFEYMGIAPADLPIVEESAEKITWLSKNPCPTLDACQRLGLDTRKVCRGAYEKSTQAFLSRIDPRLRFMRSYQEIRPHAGYCLESIVRVDFEAMMRIAIEEAKVSRREGNKGYGAVVVHGGQLVAQAHDTAATEKDPSLHAEVNAIRKAAQVIGEPNLSGAVLISSCEPCPMCSALAVWANVTSIVYGASIEETARLGKARILMSAKEMVARSPVMVEVIGGVLEEECLELYR